MIPYSLISRIEFLIWEYRLFPMLICCNVGRIWTRINIVAHIYFGCFLLTKLITICITRVLVQYIRSISEVSKQLRNVMRMPHSCCALKSRYKTRTEDINYDLKTFLWHFYITDVDNTSSSCYVPCLYKNSKYLSKF